jgi:hypothetical protein
MSKSKNQVYIDINTMYDTHNVIVKKPKKKEKKFNPMLKGVKPPPTEDEIKDKLFKDNKIFKTNKDRTVKIRRKQTTGWESLIKKSLNPPTNHLNKW